MMKKFSNLIMRHKLLAVAALLAVGWAGMGGIVHANSSGNHSYYCGFTMFGRQACHGYLSDTDFYNYDPSDSTTVAANVLIYDPSNPGGDALPATAVNSAASLIAFYETDLSHVSPTKYDYNGFGAAATVDAMIGATGQDVCSWYHPGATTCTWQAAVAYAQDPAHLATWVSSVNYYAAQGWIVWDQTSYLAAGEQHGGHACITDGPQCWVPTARTPPMQAGGDARDLVLVNEDTEGAGIIDVIAFNNPDGSHFLINRLCGNIEGQTEQLTPTPPATVTCAGMTTDTATPDPNQPFTLRVSIRYNPATAAPAAFGPDSIGVTLTGPAPFAPFSRSVSSPSITNDLVTASVTVPATHVGGTYNVSWQSTGSQTPLVSCSATLSVVYRPYFDVVGGDVSAGQGFGDGCTDNPAADIKAYNMDGSNPPGNYFGAGTRQAALATGTITSFATDETNNYTNDLGGSSDGIATHLPSGLSGSNSASSPPNYGGQYLGTYAGNWCVPDYAGSVTGAADYTSAPDWNQLAPNAGGYIVRLSGDQTLGSIQLQPGVHVTVIVTGNVYLSGNITYGSYTALQDVPQFNLLVSGGSIFIDPGVSVLHGFYDAQPTGANGGNIYTCATGSNLTDVLKDYNRCSVTPLTIYGAVAANQVVFGRTGGDLAGSGGVNDAPAEQIIYTPELWLGNLAATGSQPPQTLYQSYTVLPPVL